MKCNQNNVIQLSWYKRIPKFFFKCFTFCLILLVIDFTLKFIFNSCNFLIEKYILNRVLIISNYYFIILILISNIIIDIYITIKIYNKLSDELYNIIIKIYNRILKIYKEIYDKFLTRFF